MAQSRRRRENDTFTDMADVLPIQENAKDLDKASILRVAINYLRLRDLVGEKEALECPDDEAAEVDAGVTVKTEETESEEAKALEEENETTQLPNFAKDVLQALDGFMLVISSDGRILYTSESISTYLGLRQVDVIGISVTEIIHPQDISELAAVFKTQGKDTHHVFDGRDPLKRNFVIRMRCAFTPSVRSIARCSNFKPIYCSASLKFGKTEQTRGKFQGIVALCKLASVSRIKEMCVGAFFKTKHSLDLGYTGIDTRIRWILGYDPTEMMGHKAYQYFHPQDLTATSSCHMNLLTQGHSHSPCYRFMSRWGDWLWVRSKSYVTYNPISHMPDGLLIYTWIVRLEEDDDRMKAIQGGEEAVEKEYSNLGSSISSEGGSLDIEKLADPNAGSNPDEPPSKPAPITAPKKNPPCSVFEKRESGYLSSSSSYSSPNNSLSSTVPSPPLSVTTPPDSINYTTQHYSGNNTNACGSPESQPNSCQSSLNAGQTGYFGSSSHSLYHQQQSNPAMIPSPPYTPYDQSSPHNGGGAHHQPQLLDPYAAAMGNSFGQYTGYGMDQMHAVPISTGQATIHYTSPEQQAAPSNAMYSQMLQQQQCPLPAPTQNMMMPVVPDHLGSCGMNPTLEMQATVFTASTPSSSSSTICYQQPPNLTDLQFPASAEQATFPAGFNPTATEFSATVGMPGGGGAVDKSYVSNARERYARIAGPTHGVHVGSKRPREVPSTQPHGGISDWSPQWLQGTVPPAHVY